MTLPQMGIGSIVRLLSSHLGQICPGFVPQLGGNGVARAQTRGCAQQPPACNTTKPPWAMGNGTALAVALPSWPTHKQKAPTLRRGLSGFRQGSALEPLLTLACCLAQPIAGAVSATGVASAAARSSGKL